MSSIFGLKSLPRLTFNGSIEDLDFCIQRLCLWKLEKVNSILLANPGFSGLKRPGVVYLTWFNRIIPPNTRKKLRERTLFDWESYVLPHMARSRWTALWAWQCGREGAPTSMPLSTNHHLNGSKRRVNRGSWVCRARSVQRVQLPLPSLVPPFFAWGHDDISSQVDPQSMPLASDLLRPHDNDITADPY